MSNPNIHWAFIHPFQLRLQRGIEIYLWELASALVQSGVDVDILTWDGPLQVPVYVSPQVRIKRIPEVRYYQHLIAVPFYLSELVKNHYDHVFVHFADYGEGLSLVLARMLMDVPYSVVFHFPPSLVPHRYREFERWGFPKNASHLIAVSQATADEVEAWAMRPCAVIGHGVDTERFKPDAVLSVQTRQGLEISSNASVLISIAALEERKGIQWGLQALPQLLRENPNVQYIVVGDGPYRNPLEVMVKDLNIQSNVHFLGSILDVHPFLCAADIMLVLSKGEASSISLLEAMSCRLVSIASSHPPFDELVDDAWGKKVDEKNTQQVAAVLSDLLRTPQTRFEMGQAAREHVASFHQWHQVARQYQELIGI